MMGGSGTGRWGAVAVLVALLVGACADPAGPRTEGETHWLATCGADAECGALSCVCGVCTRTCESADACDGLGGDAVCVAMSDAVASGLCQAAAPAAGICAMATPGGSDASDAGPDASPTDVSLGDADVSLVDAEDVADAGAPPDPDGTVDAGGPGDADTSDGGDSGGSGIGPSDVTWAAVLPELGALHFNATFGLADDDVWIVGTGGVIRRWDGATWAEHDAGVTTALNGVWASAPDHVWVVGDAGVVLSWDGASWTKHEAGTTAYLQAVWGSGGSVFVVGFGLGASSDGVVLRWDGATWEQLASDSGRHWRAVHGTAPDDLWVAGSTPGDEESPWTSGTTAHWNGTTWSETNKGMGFSDIVVEADGTVTACGTTLDTDTDWPAFFTWAGDGWSLTLSPASTPLVGLSEAAGSLWAATWSGDLLHRVDGEWTIEASAGVSGKDVWVSPAATAWIVGRGGSVASGGASGFEIHSGGRDLLTGMWFGSADSGWVVGSKGRGLRWDGSAWSDVVLPTEQLLWEMHGTAPDSAWAVGEGSTALFWNGATWAAHPLDRPVDLLDVWAAAPDDVWAVGLLLDQEQGRAVIAHFDGEAWSTEEIAGPDILWGVGGAGGAVWAVGDGGAVLRREGGAWQSVPSPVTERIEDVWAASPTDAWAITAGGSILRWDGVAFTKAATASGGLTTLWGRAADDVWAVGQRTIVHWDGLKWTEEGHTMTEQTAWFYSVGGTDEVVFVAGNYGMVLKRD